MDVEGFFDTLNHELLKVEWQRLLEVDRLPPDHFAVFQACTKGYAITLPELRDIFGGEVRRRAGWRGEVICLPMVFREKVAPRLQPRGELVQKIKSKSTCTSVGIPQGLPISAVLANLYMRGADKAIAEGIRALGGTYRRYSDDLLVIVPAESAGQAEALVSEALKLVGLSVNGKKTERRRIRPNPDRLRSFALSIEGDELSACPASYLGMAFDGESIRVRPSTISKFLIKARRAIDRARFAAEESKEPRLKRRQLYARLTSIGYGRAYGEWMPGTDYPAGAPRLGFFKYLKMAERIAQSES
jgi:hypothetical protein